MAGLLLSLLVTGVALGSLYALLAVSFALIYNVTHTFHVAHASTFTITGYAVYLLSVRLGLPIAGALIASAALAALLGVLTESLLYRPLRRAGASPTIVFLASFGLVIIVEGLLGLIVGGDVLQFSNLPSDPVNVVLAVLPSANVAMVGGWLVIGATYLFLKVSRAGKYLRAVGDSYQVARSVGVPTDRVFMLSFGLGSLVAAPAALLSGWSAGLTPSMGLNPVLLAAAAVIIAGHQGIIGSAVVALGLGVLQSLAVAFVPTGWPQALTFFGLFAVVIARPQGLFGQR